MLCAALIIFSCTGCAFFQRASESIRGIFTNEKRDEQISNVDFPGVSVLTPEDLPVITDPEDGKPDQPPEELPPDDPQPDAPQPGVDTQRTRILNHLDKFGSITSLEAMQLYGIMRLASRISELRKSGYDIETVTEKGKNRYGEQTAYARYILNDIGGNDNV